MNKTNFNKKLTVFGEGIKIIKKTPDKSNTPPARGDNAK